MSKFHPGKFFAVIVMLFIAVAVAAGYYSFSNQEEAPIADDSSLYDHASQPQNASPAAPGAELTALQSDDIIYGNPDAPITIIDYSSLSCPHCAHFHNDVLPDVQKEFIDNGKAKLVFRHFPLNEPSLRAAQIVNCAPPAQKQNFIKVFFDKQGDWSFTEDFLKELKPLAALGGIDNAAFDACIANKAGEDRLLEVRKIAAEIGKVQSTPSFFINGVLLDGAPTIGNFRDAIAKAGK
jgi:protein-disulfide isomerase